MSSVGATAHNNIISLLAPGSLESASAFEKNLKESAVLANVEVVDQEWIYIGLEVAAWLSTFQPAAEEKQPLFVKTRSCSSKYAI